MSKFNKIIYISLGFIILLVPLLFMPVLKEKSKQVVKEMDFRNPLTLQEVRASEDKTKSFESFFCDYLPFRKNIIVFWANLNDTIGVTTDKNKVILGGNGYKFLGNDNELYLDQYRNLFDFSSEDIKNNIDKNTKLNDYLSQKDIGFLYVICPNKHHVYEEYMPKWTTKSNSENYIDSLNNAIKNHELSNNYIFLSDDLEKQKQQYGDYLYFKTDSHWTELGAFFGYSSIIDNINENNDLSLEKVELSGYDVKKHDGYELARNQGIDKKGIDFSISVDYYPSERPKPEYLTENHNWKTLKTTHNPNALNDMSVLVVRDSFYSAMEQYFINTFTTIYDVHYNVKIDDANDAQLFTNIIEEYNPDFVVFETIARSAAFETGIMPKSY